MSQFEAMAAPCLTASTQHAHAARSKKHFNPSDAGKLRRLLPAGALHKKWGISRSAEDAFLHLLQECIKREEPQEWSLRCWELNSYVPKSTIHYSLPKMIAAGLVTNTRDGYSLGNQGMELFFRIVEKKASRKYQNETKSHAEYGDERSETGQPYLYKENAVLSERNENPSCPPASTATETSPTPSHQLHESASGVGGFLQEKASLPEEKEHLRGQEKALAEDLLQAGCQLPGVLAAVKSASLDGRVKEARTDVRAVLAYLQLHPGWVKNPAGLLIRSVQDPARARVIRRQFRYSRTKERRARESEAKVTKAEAANAPEPIRIDLRELLEDSREIFQDLAPEVRSTIEACVNRVGHANRDRAFIDAVGQAIREARCSA